MIESDGRRLKWRLNWKLTLFSAIMVPVLIALGFWQLRRAAEKTEVLAEIEKVRQLPPLEYSAGMQMAPWRHYLLRGEFEPKHYWLQEGKTYQGRVGYEVIVPFVASGQWFLVERGWVPAAERREQLPDIEIPTGEVSIETIAIVTHPLRLIDESQNPVKGWPHRIVSIEPELMAQQFGKTMQSPVLQLVEDDPLAYQITWAPVNMPPARHIAYAAQWFAMAFTLCCLWLIASSNILELFKTKK